MLHYKTWLKNEVSQLRSATQVANLGTPNLPNFSDPIA